MNYGFIIIPMLFFLPGKAANAGGVATSALEMAQSSGRLFWSFEEVDAKLKGIMANIFKNIDAAAKKYGFEKSNVEYSLNGSNQMYNIEKSIHFQ